MSDVTSYAARTLAVCPLNQQQVWGLARRRHRTSLCHCAGYTSVHLRAVSKTNDKGSQ